MINSGGLLYSELDFPGTIKTTILFIRGTNAEDQESS